MGSNWFLRQCLSIQSMHRDWSQNVNTVVCIVCIEWHTCNHLLWNVRTLYNAEKRDAKASEKTGECIRRADEEEAVLSRSFDLSYLKVHCVGHNCFGKLAEPLLCVKLAMKAHTDAWCRLNWMDEFEIQYLKPLKDAIIAAPVRGAKKMQWCMFLRLNAHWFISNGIKSIIERQLQQIS